MAAMVTKLPKLELPPLTRAQVGVMDWRHNEGLHDRTRDLLLQLLAHMRGQGCEDYSPRGLANIIWALARLQYAPDAELRAMLVASFCNQLGEAVPQDISNVLWGVAKLTRERPAGTSVTASVVPASSMGYGVSLIGTSASTSSSPVPPSGSEPQQPGGVGAAGSSSGAPVLPSGTAAPFLSQDTVRLLLACLCQHLAQGNCGVQTISNSLWAVVVVQQEYGWCMCNCQQEVRQLLEAFARHPQGAQPGHIQPVLRAMCQLAAACANHAGAGWLSWQPKLLAQLLRYLHQQRGQLEQHQVASILRDVAQLVVLHTLVVREAANPAGTAAVMPGTPSAAGSTPAAPAAAAGGEAAGGGGGGEEQQQEQQQQQPEGLSAAAGGAAAEPEAAASIKSPTAQPPEATAAPEGVSSSSSSTAPATEGLQAAAASSRAGSSSSSSSSKVVVVKDPPLDDMLLTVLKEVAAVAGPVDPPSTLLVLNLLKQQVIDLGLLGQVQQLCEMLPLSFAGALPQATAMSKGPLAARAAGLVAAALAAGPAAAAGSRLDKLLLALSLQRMSGVLAGGCGGCGREGKQLWLNSSLYVWLQGKVVWCG
jgi:hypothetical protein